MAFNKSIRGLVVPTSGTTTIDLAEPSHTYVFTGTVTLVGGYTITVTGTPIKGMGFNIQWDAVVTVGAYTINIMGKTIKATGGDLGAAYGLTKWEAECYYDGSAWIVKFNADEITTIPEISKVADNAIEVSKIEDIGRGKILRGNASGETEIYDVASIGTGAVLITDGTDVAAKVVSGDVSIDGATGVSTIGNDKIITVKILDKNVTAAKIEDLGRGYILRGGTTGLTEKYNASAVAGAVLMTDGTDITAVKQTGDVTTDGAGVNTIGALKVTTGMIAANAVTVAKVSTNLAKTEATGITISFETGYVGAENSVKFNFAGQVTAIFTSVVKAIAGTDDASVTLANKTSPTASTVHTIPLSSAQNSEVTTVLGTPLVFAEGDVITLTSAKATAGGVVTLTLALKYV